MLLAWGPLKSRGQAPQAPVSLSTAQAQASAQDTFRNLRLEGCSSQPRDAQSLQELEEMERTCPQILQREHHPANTLTLDFLPPELFKHNFLLFQITKIVVALGNGYSKHC